MSWVRGIRECRQVEVLVKEHERRAQVGRIPGVMRTKRVCTDLPASAIARVVAGVAHLLPDHRGAGPCGSFARYASGRSWATWWSVRYLLRPVAAYYADYVPPMRFGAKPGPRGRRAA